MKDFWTPDQVLAAIVIIGCMVLIALRIDGEVKAIFGGAVAWMFRGAYEAQKSKKVTSGKS